MSRRKKSARQLRAEMLQLCGEVREDDGIDPRDFFKLPRNQQKQNRKALQLCQQVAQTLQFVLADCDDSLIESMDVVMVTPNPDSSCLRVHVTCYEDCAPGHAEQALQRQVNRLRFEISRSIHRKRVPNLVFSVFFMDKGGNDEK